MRLVVEGYVNWSAFGLGFTVARWWVAVEALWFTFTVGLAPDKCVDCGVYPTDPPSRYCPGCDGYREHQA